MRTAGPYWNAQSDESQWEPPSKWAQEKDPTSGVAYYTDGNRRRGAGRPTSWRSPSMRAARARDFARQTFPRARAPRVDADRSVLPVAGRRSLTRARAFQTFFRRFRAAATPYRVTS